MDLGTRQTRKLCRVPDPRHSAKSCTYTLTQCSLTQHTHTQHTQQLLSARRLAKPEVPLAATAAGGAGRRRRRRPRADLPCGRRAVRAPRSRPRRPPSTPTPPTPKLLGGPRDAGAAGRVPRRRPRGAAGRAPRPRPRRRSCRAGSMPPATPELLAGPRAAGLPPLCRCSASSPGRRRFAPTPPPIHLKYKIKGSNV